MVLHKRPPADSVCCRGEDIRGDMQVRLGLKLSKGKRLDTQCLLFVNSKAMVLAYEARSLSEKSELARRMTPSVIR